MAGRGLNAFQSPINFRTSPLRRYEPKQVSQLDTREYTLRPINETFEPYTPVRVIRRVRLTRRKKKKSTTVFEICDLKNLLLFFPKAHTRAYPTLVLFRSPPIYASHEPNRILRKDTVTYVCVFVGQRRENVSFYSRFRYIQFKTRRRENKYTYTISNSHPCIHRTYTPPKEKPINKF